MTKILIIKLIVLLTCLLTFSCKNEIRWDDSLKEKGFAWAGSPNNLHSFPHDYFYIKRIEYVKQKVLDRKDGKLIKNSCMLQSIENSKSSLLEAMIENSIPKTNDRTPFLFIQKQNLYRELEYDYQEKSPEILKCEPVTYSPDKIQGGEYEICECLLFLRHLGGSKDIRIRYDKLWRLMDEKDWKE